MTENLPKRKGRQKKHSGTPLNRRQELFVKELVTKDGQITMREAAITAGYPTNSAHCRAWELTNPKMNPHVVAKIREYRAELDEKFGVDYKRHIRDLQVIRDRALEEGAFAAAVQAEKARGLAQGDIYINKSEIRHGSIDSMSKEEVLKALGELKGIDDHVTIDITPTDNTRNGEKARERLVERVSESSKEATA